MHFPYCPGNICRLNFTRSVFLQGNIHPGLSGRWPLQFSTVCHLSSLSQLAFLVHAHSLLTFEIVMPGEVQSFLTTVRPFAESFLLEHIYAVGSAQATLLELDTLVS